MPYSFTLIVKRYNRQNCTLDDMSVIYSDKICLIAKNSKFADLYIHKTGKIIKGRFVKNAGSIRYPILIAEKEVHIRFDNFPKKPNIITDQYHKQDIISVVDISGCVSELPEIGKTYNCFDDGKISKSRMYQVTIDEIIPYEKANNELLELWKEQGLPNYWLFDKTDYFIKFTSNQFKDEPKGVFARTKKGCFFGLGNFWNSGRLDIDDSLTDSLSI